MITWSHDPLMNEQGAPPAARDQTHPTTLILAFTPAAMVLGTFALASIGPLNHFFNNPKVPAGLWLVLACVVSVICCIVVSFRLFRRGTAAAILGGILLLLLNGFIAFSFGCIVVLTSRHI